MYKHQCSQYSLHRIICLEKGGGGGGGRWGRGEEGGEGEGKEVGEAALLILY